MHPLTSTTLLKHVAGSQVHWRYSYHCCLDPALSPCLSLR
jgi:hypothetical protein